MRRCVRTDRWWRWRHHVFATGYAECARALREPDLLFANDPHHERYRRFFSSAFSAHRVAAGQGPAGLSAIPCAAWSPR
jgi:cytochrome P450